MGDVRISSTARDHLHLKRIGTINRSFLTNTSGHSSIRTSELNPYLPIAVDETAQDRVGRLHYHQRSDCARQRSRSREVSVDAVGDIPGRLIGEGCA